MRAWALACTDAATEAQTGTGAAAMNLPVFPTPDPAPGVGPVNPGALTRIFALVQQIKDSGLSTDTIATNLGILGSAQTAPDLTTIQPEISARSAAARC